MAKAKTLKWKRGSSDATVEGEPEFSIEILRPIMVGGAMALPGDEVVNVPEHMARGLAAVGRARIAA